MDTINVGVLLSACIDVAQRAGNEIRKVWKSGDLGVKDKGNDDPFTKADINSQMLIMGVLHKTWPKLTMIGEENIEIPSSTLVPNLDLINLDKVPASFQKVPLSDICVFIDPLDATKEFTLGNLEAVITLIGISYKGDPVAGVMYQPFVDDESGNGTTIYGMQGLGLFGVTPKHNPSHTPDSFVLTTTRSHSSPEVEKSITLLKPKEVIKIGGAGFKVLLLLQGKADVYVFPTTGTKKWDTCSPQACLEAAGGKMTDIDGKPLLYTKDCELPNSNGILCTMADHQVYLDRLKPLKQ